MRRKMYRPGLKQFPTKKSENSQFCQKFSKKPPQKRPCPAVVARLTPDLRQLFSYFLLGAGLLIPTLPTVFCLIWHLPDNGNVSG